MITDERIADVNHEIAQLTKELEEFKEVVVHAVSKLNARINALERRLPPLKLRRGNGSRSISYIRPGE
jgi:hypothetical protein